MNNRDQIKLEIDTLILNKYSIEEISQDKEMRKWITIIASYTVPK